jgi:predicted ester cyclase
MSTANENAVKRYYEEMCNGRHNDIADEIFTPRHRLHDPQIQTGEGPQGMADAVRPYQQGVEGHWEINEMYSINDTVVVHWIGSGRHTGEVNGIPATGNPVRQIEAISIHRMDHGKIAETWEVWDTLGFLQQIGVVPQA